MTKPHLATECENSRQQKLYVSNAGQAGRQEGDFEVRAITSKLSLKVMPDISAAGGKNALTSIIPQLSRRENRDLLREE